MAAVLTDESMDSTRMDSETAGGGAGSIKVGASTTAGRAGGSGSANYAGGAISGSLGNPDQALSGNQAGANQNMDALLKRLMKFKHLEDDNKKLKNLLK